MSDLEESTIPVMQPTSLTTIRTLVIYSPCNEQNVEPTAHPSSEPVGNTPQGFTFRATRSLTRPLVTPRSSFQETGSLPHPPATLITRLITLVDTTNPDTENLSPEIEGEEASIHTHLEQMLDIMTVVNEEETVGHTCPSPPPQLTSPTACPYVMISVYSTGRQQIVETIAEAVRIHSLADIGKEEEEDPFNEEEEDLFNEEEEDLFNEEEEDLFNEAEEDLFKAEEEDLFVDTPGSENGSNEGQQAVLLPRRQEALKVQLREGEIEGRWGFCGFKYEWFEKWWEKVSWV